MASTHHPRSSPGAPDGTDLLVVGAGPFGLAMAAHAQELEVDHVIVGEPMSFWQEHMPKGMFLRSGCDWHLDPGERATIENFLATRDQKPEDVEPLSLELYLEYVAWFQRARNISVRRAHVACLEEVDGSFRATLGDGSTLTAERVLLALGFAPFAHIPEELRDLVPTESSSHTCDYRPFDRFAGQRILIVGGRQSAFESAALLTEAGAGRVYVCHRHDTPDFTRSDWSWADPLIERTGEDPGWYRRLTETEREALNKRFWQEGRLKLEPWLGARVHRPEIALLPRTRIADCENRGEMLEVRLDTGERVQVDHVLYATGYKVDLARVPLLERGGLLDRIECRNGFPVLDERMQTSVPGLFMTSLPASQDFGLFFAFTAAVRASARIVGRALVE